MKNRKIVIVLLIIFCIASLAYVVVDRVIVATKHLLGGMMTSYENYNDRLAGSKYLLFLGWTESWGHYGVDSAHEGKFNIDGKDKAEANDVTKNER